MPSSCGSSAPRCGASASCGWPPSTDGSRSSSASTTCGTCSRSSSCSRARAFSSLEAPRPRSCRRVCIVFASGIARCSAAPRRDRVERLHDLPLQFGVEHRALIERSPRHSKRRSPNGVRSAARAVPPAGAAGPARDERRAASRSCRGNRRSRSRPRCAFRRTACRCRGCPARSGSRRTACPSRGGCPSGAPPSRISRGSSWARSVSSLVEQVALAVALVDGAEDPAVAVEVGELRVLRASR